MAQVPVPPPPFIGDSTVSRWLNLLWKRVNTAGQILWSTLQFDGSNLTDLETRNHNDLQNIQGGVAGKYYHLTAGELSGVRAPPAPPVLFPEEYEEPLFVPHQVTDLSSQTDLQAALDAKARRDQLGAYFTADSDSGEDFPMAIPGPPGAAGTGGSGSLDKWVLVFAAAHG